MSKTNETERSIELVPLDELTSDPRNPKAHDTATIEQSVSRFGYVEPVIIDGRTGQIVSGHGRTKTLRAMRDSGETPPEGVIVDGRGWLVPVVTGWSSRSDTEAAAALIALNRTTELGGWVDDSLLSLLDELDSLDGVGYTETDIEALRRKLTDIEDDPDHVDFDSIYEIVVSCDSEADQERLLTELMKQGLNVRALSA